MKKKNEDITIQQEVAFAVNLTNDTIAEIGVSAEKMNDKLENIMNAFTCIRNIPSEYEAERIKAQEARSEWLQQAEKIEEVYNTSMKKNIGNGTAGAGVGVAVVTMGPTAAMGVATTFGVASTGTAISSLSGAAATNAALAWLGGGALAAGGGGMVAGEAFLALAGPVGWSIAGIAILASGIAIIKGKSEKKKLINLFNAIGERDKKNYETAVVEMNERIRRMEEEIKRLNDAFERIKTFGVDYEKMTESQQYELGAYYNLVSAATRLIVSPIKGLEQKYTDEHYDRFVSVLLNNKFSLEYFKAKNIMVYLANLLYGIKMDDKDKELLAKSIKVNKELLNTMGITKSEFKAKFVFMAYDEMCLIRMRQG